MRSEEAQRTKGSRDRKERKRQDREAARLAAQYAFSGFNIVLARRGRAVKSSSSDERGTLLLHAVTYRSCEGAEQRAGWARQALQRAEAGLPCVYGRQECFCACAWHRLECRIH